MVSTSAMLSKPCPVSSAGNSLLVSKLTPSRSRIVFRYSVRLSRRTVTRPGSGSSGSILNADALIQPTNLSTCSGFG